MSYGPRHAHNAQVRRSAPAAFCVRRMDSSPDVTVAPLNSTPSRKYPRMRNRKPLVPPGGGGPPQAIRPPRPPSPGGEPADTSRTVMEMSPVSRKKGEGRAIDGSDSSGKEGRAPPPVPIASRSTPAADAKSSSSSDSDSDADTDVFGARVPRQSKRAAPAPPAETKDGSEEDEEGGGVPIGSRFANMRDVDGPRLSRPSPAAGILAHKPPGPTLSLQQDARQPRQPAGVSFAPTTGTHNIASCDCAG